MSELIIVSSLGNECKDINVHKIVTGNADAEQEISTIATARYPTAPVVSADGLLADFASNESEYVLQQTGKGLNVYKKATRTTPGWFTSACFNKASCASSNCSPLFYNTIWTQRSCVLG